jgi:hypothetical protein
MRGRRLRLRFCTNQVEEPARETEKDVEEQVEVLSTGNEQRLVVMV